MSNHVAKKKTTKREVNEAAGKYGDAVIRWGENNQATVRAFSTYWDLRAQWEADHGKPWSK
jgi:hypothetical protein